MITLYYNSYVVDDGFYYSSGFCSYFHSMTYVDQLGLSSIETLRGLGALVLLTLQMMNQPTMPCQPWMVSYANKRPSGPRSFGGNRGFRGDGGFGGGLGGNSGFEAFVPKSIPRFVFL
ncbi:hypothetical protein PTKIN_Ptkin17bG0048400 [Pterospermum kingtungense]